MTPVYLSADNPRWTPRSEADLRAAIEDGLIEESHYLDLKEATPSGKGDNKETARDLASFAIDSGTLIIGVGEDKANRRFFLAPQPLDGLPEKIEQVARFNTDPPLSVLTQTIPSEADPGKGYLIVHVPASPVAPHMVDGRYYGRGDKTKYTLPDPEVVRLHERRRSAAQDALALLRREVERDPIPADQRRQAHLFLVAQPLAGPANMLMKLASGNNWNANLAAFIQQADTLELNTLLKDIGGISPSLQDATNGFRRGRGAARATPNLGEGRKFTPTSNSHPEDAVELQVHEDGGLRLFFSRLSDRLRNEDNEEVLLDAAFVDYTRRFIALVRFAGEYAGYFGNWALALGATGLDGLRANPYSDGWGFGPHSRYDEDTYTATTGVSWADLNSAPGEITGRLTGPILRALGTEARYKHVFHD